VQALFEMIGALTQKVTFVEESVAEFVAAQVHA
jgi:hypothetical protein